MSQKHARQDSAVLNISLSTPVSNSVSADPQTPSTPVQSIQLPFPETKLTGSAPALDTPASTTASQLSALTPLQTASNTYPIQAHHEHNTDSHHKQLLPELSIFLPYKPHYSNAFATMIDTDLLYVITSSSMIIISTMYELTYKESRTLNKRYSSVKTPRVYALCVEMVPRQDLLSKPQSVLSTPASTTPHGDGNGDKAASTHPEGAAGSSNNGPDGTPVIKDTPESLYCDAKKPDIPIIPSMYHLFIPTVSLRIYSSFPMNQTQWRNPVETIKLSPPAFIMKPQHITHSQMLSERSQKAANGANLHNTQPAQPLTEAEKQVRHIESLIWCEEALPPVIGNSQPASGLQLSGICDTYKPFYAFQLPLTTSGPNGPAPTTLVTQPAPSLPSNQSQGAPNSTPAAPTASTTVAPSPAFGASTPGSTINNNSDPVSKTSHPSTLTLGSQSSSLTAQPSPSHGSTGAASASLTASTHSALEPSQFSLGQSTSSRAEMSETDNANGIDDDRISGRRNAEDSSKALSLDTFFDEPQDQVGPLNRSRQNSMEHAATPSHANQSTPSYTPYNTELKSPQNQQQQQQQQPQQTQPSSAGPAPQQHQQPQHPQQQQQQQQQHQQQQQQQQQQPQSSSQKVAKTDFFSATWGAFTKSITPTPPKPIVTTSTTAQPNNQPNTINQRFLCSMNPNVSRCWVFSLNWVCDSINDHLSKYNTAARGRKRGDANLPYPPPINFLSFPVPNEPLLNIYSFPPRQSITSPYHPDHELKQSKKIKGDEKGGLADNNAEKPKDPKGDLKVDIHGEHTPDAASQPTSRRNSTTDIGSATVSTKDAAAAQAGPAAQPQQPQQKPSPPQQQQQPHQPDPRQTVSTTNSPSQSALASPDSITSSPNSNNLSTSLSTISLNAAQPILIYNNLGHIVKMNREVDYTHLFQPSLSVVHTSTNEIVPVYSDLINFERFITEIQNQLKLSQPITPVHLEGTLRVSSNHIVTGLSDVAPQDEKVEKVEKPEEKPVVEEKPASTELASPSNAGDNWFTKMFKASTYTAKPAQPATTATTEPKPETTDEPAANASGDAAASGLQDDEGEAVSAPYNVIHPKLANVTNAVPVTSYLGLQAMQQVPPFQHHPPVHPMNLMKEASFPISLKQFYYLCVDNTAPLSMTAFHTSLPEQFFQVKAGEWSVCTPSLIIDETNNKANQVTPVPYPLLASQKAREEPISLPTTAFQRAVGHTIPPINVPLPSTSSPFTPTALSWDPSTPEDNITSLLTAAGAAGAVSLTPAELYNTTKDTGYVPVWKQYLFRTISMKSRVSTPTGMVETRLFKTQRLAAFYATVKGQVEIVGLEMEVCSSTPDVKFGDSFVVVDSMLAFSSKVLEAAGVGGPVPAGGQSALFCDAPSIQLITRSNVKFIQSSWAMKAFTGIINSRSRSDNATIVGQYYDWLDTAIGQAKALDDGKIISTIDNDMMWPPVVHQSNAAVSKKGPAAAGAAAVEAVVEEEVEPTEPAGPTNEQVLENTLKLVEVPPQLHPLFILPVCLFGLPILSFLTGQGFTIPTNLVMCLVIAVVMMQVVNVQKDLITVKKQQSEILTLLKKQQADPKKGGKK